uniref:Beta-adaptin appendage C-terminal subdomain domain-containing protein n=1 Tax=Periophthalmus magnuspinnatus TaxID=409849 RepID=A0A3B4AKK9_9GOBI
MPYLSGEDTVKELRRALSNPNVQSDPLRYRNTITKVIRLKECDVWAQSDILRILERYCPQTEGELFDILSLLDSCLICVAPPVMAATLRLFLCLCSSLPAVCHSALERACGPLLTACGSSSREMRFSALAHIQVLLGAHYKRFFCGYAEPAFIKQRKMQVLVELVNDENVSMLLDELKGYCTDVNPETAQAAISAIGRIARSYSDKCLEILTGLLGLKQEHITSAVVQTLRDLVWACPQCSDIVCTTIEGCEQIIQDAQGRQALLWLLGAHGERVPSAPYALEGFIDGVRFEGSLCVKMELLSAALRLFLCRPAEMQDMLGRLLHYCIEEESDMCVRDHALLYYRLLHCGIEETRRFVQMRRSDPGLGVLIGRPQQSINSWAQSFNTMQPLCGATTTPDTSTRGSPEHTNFYPKTNLSKELRTWSLSGAVTLSLSPALSPNAFQDLWLQLQSLQTDKGNTFTETYLQAALQLVNIQTMAFTPTNVDEAPDVDEVSQDKTFAAKGMEFGKSRVKVTVRQKPRDEPALMGFLSILSTVLNTVALQCENSQQGKTQLS